jgi:hypothetical protein
LLKDIAVKPVVKQASGVKAFEISVVKTGNRCTTKTYIVSGLASLLSTPRCGNFIGTAVK